MSADKKKRRQATGCLVIARSDRVLHTSKGIETSWLCTPDPACFLLTMKDVVRSRSSEFRSDFLLPAMHAPFPDYVLDILVNKNGEIVYKQGILVLKVTEGECWSSARLVCSIPWRDIITTENENRLWRDWSNDWFRSLL